VITLKEYEKLVQPEVTKLGCLKVGDRFRIAWTVENEYITSMSRYNESSILQVKALNSWTDDTTEVIPLENHNNNYGRDSFFKWTVIIKL
jgi:hypothetical protein